MKPYLLVRNKQYCVVGWGRCLQILGLFCDSADLIQATHLSVFDPYF